MPQPIDPFTEIARVHAAERIQQIADRASLAAQSRLHAAQEQALVNAETQVHQTEQKGSQVERELKRQTPFSGRKHHREEAGEEDASQQDEPEANQETISPTLYDPKEGLEPGPESQEHHLDVSI